MDPTLRRAPRFAAGGAGCHMLSVDKGRPKKTYGGEPSARGVQTINRSLERFFCRFMVALRPFPFPLLAFRSLTYDRRSRWAGSTRKVPKVTIPVSPIPVLTSGLRMVARSRPVPTTLSRRNKGPSTRATPKASVFFLVAGALVLTGQVSR